MGLGVDANADWQLTVLEDTFLGTGDAARSPVGRRCEPHTAVPAGKRKKRGQLTSLGIHVQFVVVEFDADVLAQMPETSVGGDGGTVPLAARDGDTDLLDARDIENLRDALKKYEMFSDRDMPDRAVDYAAEACELAGVEDVEQIDQDDLLAK